jgi:NAD(P)H-dependent FMN reductase
VVTIALVSGSTRSGSTNTAALRTIAELASPPVRAGLYEGLPDLPAFNPDRTDAGPAVDDLRGQLRAADAVLICSPEYAGTLPGSLKNLIDWTVGGGELYRKPVAFINVAAAGRGGGADATLRTVLGYVDADLIEPACVRVPVARDEVGESGTVVSAETRAALAAVLAAIVEHVRALEPAERAIEM